MSRSTAGVTVAAIAVALGCLAAPVAAQDYALDVSVATSAKAATFQVAPGGGSIPLTFLNTGKASGGAITISVTPFLSEAGERIEPQLSAGNQRGAALTLKTASELVSCDLVVPALRGPGPFTGSLIIRTGKAAPTRQVVAITPSTAPRPAVLQVMPETDSKPFVIVEPMFRSHVPAPSELDASLGPTFDIRLRDGGAKWTVDRVTLGPLTVVKSPDGFTASDHLAFYDERHRLITFPRDIPTSGETLTLQLRNLSAGEYSATIPFHAANGAIEPTRFTFTANVKHHWAWAVLCVSIALLLSFSASKLVDVRNERLRLAKRIDQVQPGWLDEEEQTAAIVWVISIVSQASRLSQTWFLPNLETIHARLDKVEALLQPIASLRRVRTEIERSQALPTLAKTRALTMVRRIAEGLDPDMDQAMLNEQAAAIAALRDWTRGDPVRPYAADLAVSIAQLIGNVDVAAMPASGRALAQKLVDELTTALPTAPKDLNTREQHYARLKILWERRRAAEFPELVAVAEGPIDGLFEAADRAAWARLRQSRRRTLSCDGAERIDAHEPITFEFSTGDPDLDDTYFVKHALRYEWSFRLTGTKAALSTRRNTFTTSPKTKSPRVPQFALFPGTLEPSVTVFFKSFHEEVHGAPVTIWRSRAFTPAKGFSVGEMVQLALAFVAAVTTGLQTFYFKAGGFGSLPDYLTLFAWGATIDQFKNFLQKLPTATQSIQGTAVSSTNQGTASTAAATATSQTATVVTTPVTTSSGSQSSSPSVATSSSSSPQQPAASSSAQSSQPVVQSRPSAEKKPPDIPDPPRVTSLPLEEET